MEATIHENREIAGGGHGRGLDDNRGSGPEFE